MMTVGVHDIAHLQEHVQGKVLAPSDPDYDQTREVWNAGIVARPAAIVRAGCATDVRAAITFARGRGLPIAVRSGGHGLAGYGIGDGAVLIDLRAMTRLDVDPAQRVAHIEAGLSWGAVAGQLHAHGLALTSGDTSTVGVGGLTLGGGIGWMVRKYGLTIDHLRAVELVTANGEIVTASAEHHADLFWGMRGGGGNFGVATAFHFSLDPVSMVLGGAVFYDAADAHKVLPAYSDYAARAPEELTTMAMIMPAPPAPFVPPQWHGRPVLMLVVCYCGDLAAGEAAVAPLRRLADPVAELLAPMPYPVMFTFAEEATHVGKQQMVRSAFLAELGDELLRTIADQAPTVSEHGAIIQLRMLGGAMARIAPDATAFAHRDKPAMLSVFNTWAEAAESRARHAWTERIWRAWQPHVAGVYANFLQDEGAARIGAAYPPATYARLARLKQRYDQENTFRHNQNIQPSHTSAALDDTAAGAA